MLYALIPWYVTNRIGASYPRVKAFFSALRQNEPDLPLGAAGFCWGGKHVVFLAADCTEADRKPLLDAGFTGHPSLLDMPGDIEKIRVPVAFAIGDKDLHIPKEQVETIQSIVESAPEQYRGEVRVYPDCGHGFCIRADTRFEEVARQAAAAEDHCIAWFDRQFGLRR
jgi:dienelactone hydrolase